MGIRGARQNFLNQPMGFGITRNNFGAVNSSTPFPCPSRWVLTGRVAHPQFDCRLHYTLSVDGQKDGYSIDSPGYYLAFNWALTQAMQEESRMQIDKGESKNYLERFHGVELAFIDVTAPDTEQVVSLPQELLEKGGIHYCKDLL